MNKHIAILSILCVMILSMATEVVRGGDGPPSNDSFAAALPIVLENGSGAATSINDEATKQPGEPDHAGNVGGKSLWYKLIPATTTVVRVNVTGEVGVDTLLAVYTGGSVDALTLIAFNDDCHSQCGGGSTVDLMVTAGTTYYIAVDGFNDSGTVSSGIFQIAVLDNNLPYQDDLVSAYNLHDGHRGSIGGTNYNATRQAGEVDHINPNYVGQKSVWYKWKSVGTQGMAVELTENFNSQITIFKSPVGSPTFAQLTRVTFNIDSEGDAIDRYRVKFLAETGVYYFFAIAGHSHNPQAPNSGNFQMTFRPSGLRYSIDVDPFRDGAATSVFRPSNGTWYTLPFLGTSSGAGHRWGMSGDVPIAADFTGDGMSEYAVVRNENGAKVWYIDSAPVETVMTWGLASDKAVVGDFDSDSRADPVAIRNTAQGLVWYVRQSYTGSMRAFTFGTTGDRPILGDFDGDGKTEVAVVRNTVSGLVWYILYSAPTTGFASYVRWSGGVFGQAPDVPAVEDFDGDGKTDIAVFRPSNGTWYILQSSNGQVRSDAFGASGDKPQPADFDADGKADLCVFRPSGGTWYIARPTGAPGQNFYSIAWGASTDTPVTSLSTLSQ